jgi:hypothetical protein
VELLLESWFEPGEILVCLPLPVFRGLVEGLDEHSIKAAPLPLRDADLEGDLMLPVCDVV